MVLSMAFKDALLVVVVIFFCSEQKKRQLRVKAEILRLHLTASFRNTVETQKITGTAYHLIILITMHRKC